MEHLIKLEDQTLTKHQKRSSGWQLGSRTWLHFTQYTGPGKQKQAIWILNLYRGNITKDWKVK